MSLRALLAALLLAAPAAWAGERACPKPSTLLVFHSCWHASSQVEIRLLPEDGLPEIQPKGVSVALAGTYTAEDRRSGDKPLPTGIFIRKGEIVSRRMGRMDGVLIAGPRGAVSVFHRARVPLDGRTLDIRKLKPRAQFLEAMAKRRHSVLQTHLLVVDGKSDVRPRDGAPRFVRRMFFAGPKGYGIWQTPTRMTLHKAAEAIIAALKPEMALNLDMGSFDFCIADREGERELCGLVPPSGAGKLSNLIRLSHP